MADYKKMYQSLFTASEKAIAMLEKGETERARRRLIEGELRAENIYIETCDEKKEPENEEDRRAQIDATFFQFAEQAREALQWLAEHRAVMDKLVTGEELDADEMKALIAATTRYGAYPLYYIHLRKTELDEGIAYAAAKTCAERRAAEQTGQ